MNDRIRVLAILGIAATATSFAAAATSGEARQYHVTDTIVGSAVPQAIIDGPLPFDSPYAALTPQQKDVLFDDYERLAPGDEPPFPLYGIRHLIQPMLSYVETYSPVGPVVAAVEVDSKGNAVAVTMYRSPDPELTRIVQGAMAFEKYKPAVCSGQPCKMQYVLQVDIPARHGLPVQELAFKRYDQSTANFSRR